MLDFFRFMATNLSNSPSIQMRTIFLNFISSSFILSCYYNTIYILFKLQNTFFLFFPLPLHLPNTTSLHLLRPSSWEQKVVRCMCFDKIHVRQLCQPEGLAHVGNMNYPRETIRQDIELLIKKVIRYATLENNCFKTLIDCH